MEAASTSLPIKRFEISGLEDVFGRQPTPTVVRKAPPGLTPTLPDDGLPIILPILQNQ
jgi:hypothetical protein